MSKVVIFPSSKKTSAQSYAAWTDTAYDTLFPGAGRYSYSDGADGGTYLDAYGQYVTSYLGPNFIRSGVEVPEPTSADPSLDGPTQRADGVLSDTWTPPVDE